jgi:hypothetical protein
MASKANASDNFAKGKLDLLTSTVGSAGLLRIYDGTQPAGPDTAVSTQNKLAEFTCGTPFSGSATMVSSQAQISPTLPANVNGLLTGTASWARLLTSGGTAVYDLSVGTSGCDVNLTNATITSGQAVSVTSWTVRGADHGH